MGEGVQWGGVWGMDRPDGELAMTAYLAAPDPIPTGYDKLDQLLGGGMVRGLTVIGGPPSSGKSVVVEYVNGQMLVTETKVVTNHYLANCEKQGVGSKQSHIRFDTLISYTEPADDIGVRDMLKSVAQNNYPQTEGKYEKTMWSIVYCPEGLCADFYFAENYEHSYGLLLREKGSFLKR